MKNDEKKMELLKKLRKNWNKKEGEEYPEDVDCKDFEVH